MANSSVETAKEETKQVVREARPWIKTLARLGYAAKGVVYVLIGMMAMLFALGQRGQPIDFTRPGCAKTFAPFRIRTEQRSHDDAYFSV